MMRGGGTPGPMDQPCGCTDKPQAEFDQFAEGYDSGMDCHLKRLVGKTAEAFIEVKVRWLLHDLRTRPFSGRQLTSELDVLDFGCGTGLFLKLLKRNGLPGRLHGCDVSKGMLDEAIRNWDQGPLPKFDLITGEHIPYAEGVFDLVIACAVFHHIPPQARSTFCGEIARVLKPGGRVYVFEHNPYNPVTQWVVSRTPIDRNAVLVTVKEMSDLLGAAGFRGTRSEYLLFFPPTWQWIRRVEKTLRWLPLGGQWVVTSGIDG